MMLLEADCRGSLPRPFLYDTHSDEREESERLKKLPSPQRGRFFLPSAAADKEAAVALKQGFMFSCTGTNQTHLRWNVSAKLLSY